MQLTGIHHLTAISAAIAENHRFYTQTLGMRLQDSLILNRDRLQGSRELAVNVGSRRVGLEFALFAVPLAT